MKLPQWLGPVVYIVGYPFFRLMLWRSHRAYVIVIVDNKALLIKNWLRFNPKWRLPGGGIRKSESSVEGAARELSEELHIEVNPVDLLKLGNKTFTHSRLGYAYDIFVHEPKGSIKLIYKINDIIDHTFIDKSEINNIVLDEEPLTAFRALNWQ